MIYLSDMYIRDEDLRKNLELLLTTKSRNEIVESIKATGVKFHQYNIDRFIQGKAVSIETLKKLDKYVTVTMQLEYNQ